MPTVFSTHCIPMSWWGGSDRDYVPADNDSCHCECQDYPHPFFSTLTQSKHLRYLYNNLMEKDIWFKHFNRKGILSFNMTDCRALDFTACRSWEHGLHLQLIWVCSVWCQWQVIRSVSGKMCTESSSHPASGLRENKDSTCPTPRPAQSTIREDSSS